MWALRRVVNPLRCRGYHIGATRASSVGFDIFTVNLEQDVCAPDHGKNLIGRGLLPRGFSVGTSMTENFSIGSRGLSSHAGEKATNNDDDLEEGFSELETSIAADFGKEKKDEEVEHADEIQAEASENEISLLDLESVETDKKVPGKSRIDVASPLFKLIMEPPHHSVKSALDKWIEEGNSLERTEYYDILHNLRKRKIYGKALGLSEWVESKKLFDFDGRDYATRVDLLAKVLGISKAEKYIEHIPKSFQGKVMYGTLLSNCVRTRETKKAEETFNKMKQLKFAVTSFVCNQLLLLYKRSNRSKIRSVLEMMEEEDIKPSRITYHLLIDIKGQECDIDGMEKVLETMKSDGIEPDLLTQAVVAKHYIFAGQKEKGEAILKEMEAGDLKQNRGACKALLPLYASLGKADEVGRVWQVVEPTANLEERISAIEAWGKLGRVEDAEAVFENLFKTWKRPPLKSYTALMMVYANHNLLSKGKELVKKLTDNGGSLGPSMWDVLVKLYVGAGELEKADSILHKVAEQNPNMKPFYTSYMTIMYKYAKKGDVHNAEKIFHRLRQTGYSGRSLQYQTLLQAYVNASAPPYGFRERMKADNMIPNKFMTGLLNQSDPFKTTPLSELLN
ncbi:Pentatricopeptide repeat-containing protein [Acorus gramineus]|uniref:Pentatricopeptide repeat-containing protein n=1 Tax=Acorus gramineus TaxID=55184 RepID=A0AAV9BZ56_ACOGR|nr:Pentatricopeptide repeat-containing protein [Acorus gramineus]